MIMNAQMDHVERNTLGDKVYEVIKTKIIRAEFVPGTRLKESELARMLDVSTTPVREAVRRLESEGLIESVPYKGTFVRGMSLVTIEHIYEVRMGLEQLAAELVCSSIRKAELEAMESLVREYERAYEDNDVAACLETDMAFHGLLVQATGNEVLLEVYRGLAVRIQALRTLDEGQARRRQSLEDHKAMLRAVKAQDLPRARAVVKEHITKGKEHVLSLLAESQEGGTEWRSKG